MLGNILVFKGQSRYNVLRIAADYMVDSFRKKGYNVTIADLTIEGQLSEVLASALDKSYVLIFSFQALLFDLYLSDNKTLLLNAINTPVFGHIVDHPVYHHSRIAQPLGDKIYLGSIDKSHVEYVEKYYPHIKHAVFLPHAGFLAHNIIPYENRTVDLYFPSSYTNPSATINKIKDMPDIYQTMSMLLIKNMLKDPFLTLQNALATYLNEVNFTYLIDEFTELMDIFSIVDGYIRAYTRDKCIRCLLENNISVTVSGNGWDNFESDFQHNLIIMGSNGIDFLNVLEIIANSKMVLNDIATYQTGLHERIFTSMLCGAICLTNDFPIIHDEFTDRENILLFSHNQLQRFADKINTILASPDLAIQIAYKGNLIASQYHTWSNNADEILRIVGLQA